MKFEPEQLEKRNYARWVIDGYAMQILAPALTAEKHPALHDISQIIHKSHRK